MMNEINVQNILKHPDRLKYTTGISLTIGLFVVWPLYDTVRSTGQQIEQTQQEIQDLKAGIANVAPLRQRIEAIGKEIDADFRTVDEETAQRLRDTCVKSMFQHHVAAVQIRLSDAVERPWRKGQSPFDVYEVDQENIRFVLVERKLSIVAEGRPNNIDRLLSDLENLHPFARYTRMNLRENAQTDTVALELELTLLDLKRKTTT